MRPLAWLTNYDGGGGKVKRITGEGTTLYLGETFELAPDGTTTQDFFAGR